MEEMMIQLIEQIQLQAKVCEYIFFQLLDKTISPVLNSAYN